MRACDQIESTRPRACYIVAIDALPSGIGGLVATSVADQNSVNFSSFARRLQSALGKPQRGEMAYSDGHGSGDAFHNLSLRERVDCL
jgi:hypothetical protein